MAIIVTYDVPSKHVELKTAMKKLGYEDQISDDTCKTVYFPNTTLYHHNKTAVTARDELQAECRKLHISLARCVATLWTGWAAVCGESF